MKLIELLELTDLSHVTIYINKRYHSISTLYDVYGDLVIKQIHLYGQPQPISRDMFISTKQFDLFQTYLYEEQVPTDLFYTKIILEITT